MYGILKSLTNTGNDSELNMVFSTPLSIVSNQPSFSVDTLNLKRITNSQNVQRWEIEANLAQTNDSATYLVSSVLNGHTEKVYVRMPQVYRLGRSKPNQVSITVLNAQNKLGNTLVVSNASPNYLLVGDFIGVQGTNKVHLITGISGNTLTVYPRLLANIAANSAISFGDAVTLFARYDNDVKLGITYTDGILSDPGSVRLIEAL